jgi:hypothetical protein
LLLKNKKTEKIKNQKKRRKSERKPNPRKPEKKPTKNGKPVAYSLPAG